MISWFDDLSKDDRNLYFDLRGKIQEIKDVISDFPMPLFFERDRERFPIPPLPLNGNLIEFDDYSNLPEAILEETSYAEFLTTFVSYAQGIVLEFRDLMKKYDV